MFAENISDFQFQDRNFWFKEKFPISEDFVEYERRKKTIQHLPLQKQTVALQLIRDDLEV